ncbi:MAG: hydrogen gas-evolving membrane-bound hydrogenase subunit E [Dehalococcoidia bacterium]
MLPILLALPLAAALAVAVLARTVPGRTRLPGAAMALASLAAFGLLLSQLPTILDGEAVQVAYGWVEALGWSFAFRLDGLSALFALLITGIGTLIGWYGRAYMGEDARNARFFATLLIFQAGMLIAVLADGFAVLFVGWEITSISSFLLIGFSHENPDARRSAQHALLVTSAGGLALLGGLVLLGVATEEWRFSSLTAELVADADQALVTGALVLVLLGAFTKSAQFPFHGWLPGAMTAPTPVSAYLHSATMVKLGVYLLARFQPSLGDLALWGAVLPVVGGITMLLGAVLAVRERDLKRLLAYSTVSALGWMVLLAGLGTTDALKALAVTLVAHAAYKASLFMTAGTIDHETGTRDRLALGGLRGGMPLLAGSAGIAAVSMAGLPPALGFLSKETTLAAAFEEDGGWLIASSVVVMGALTLVAAYAAGVAPFLGGATKTPKHAHEGPPGLWAPVAMLATLGIVAGAAGPMLLTPFLDEVVTASYGSPYETYLTFFTGFDAIFASSAIAIGAGVVLARWHRAMPAIPWLSMNTTAVLQGLLDGLATLAEVVERRTQHGSLPVYVATAIAAAVVPLLAVTAHAGPLANVEIEGDPLVAAMAVVVGIGAFAAARSQTRIRSVAALGATGFGITLIFLYFGAPDLAMTQALVETLTVILFIFAFRYLPIRRGPQDLRRHYSALAIAGVAGLATTGLTLLLVAEGSSSHLRQFFETASYPEARGTNVVNTILVDFRALDTLGEISVLAVAALGILALLRLTGRSASRVETGGHPQVLRTAARGLLPLLVVFAFFLFLRGHDQPGGGFVAGLVVAAGVALYAMAYNARDARRLLRVPPRTFMAAGLLVAVASAAFGTWEHPLLTGQWTTIALPADGELKVGTPLFFDFGVFLVVLGVASALATALLEEQR